MLEGLEVSVLKLSELERTVRFDAEFYKINNLKTIKILKQKEYKLLTDYVSVSDGNHMSISENFSEEGIPYYRGQDVHDFFIEQSNPICIDEITFSKPVMKRSHLQKGDLLLSIVGTIGKLSLVYTNQKQTCSCKLAILRPNVSAEFLAVILSSYYGQTQIQRLTRGAVQMGLILEDMNQILIPVLDKKFQNEIEKIVKQAYDNLEQSKTLYTQAEQILLEELGFTNSSPLEGLGVVTGKTSKSIKTFKESYESSSRLDAEYYQPKYDSLMEQISHFNNQKLAALVSIKKSIEPGSIFYQSTGIPFLRVANITKHGLTETDIYLDEALFTNKDLLPKKDTILLSKDGSIGIAYKIEEDIKAITSSALLHLTVISVDTILPDYLTLVLNSPIVQLQAERDCGGSIIQHWRMEEIENVVIPILPYKTQTQISSLIQQSFQLRQQSKHLLEVAKQAVETAIEQNEVVALDFIQANTKYMMQNK